jgi:hypothetical protein
MIVLVDNDDILIALLQKDGRGDKSANARPQNHDLKSVRRAAVIRSRGIIHIVQFSLQRTGWEVGRTTKEIPPHG